MYKLYKIRMGLQGLTNPVIFYRSKSLISMYVNKYSPEATYL